MFADNCGEFVTLRPLSSSLCSPRLGRGVGIRESDSLKETDMAWNCREMGGLGGVRGRIQKLGLRAALGTITEDHAGNMKAQNGLGNSSSSQNQSRQE